MTTTEIHWNRSPGAAPRDQRVLVAFDYDGRLATCEARFAQPFGFGEEPDPRWETMRDADGIGNTPVPGEVYAWALMPTAPQKEYDA